MALALLKHGPVLCQLKLVQGLGGIFIMAHEDTSAEQFGTLKTEIIIELMLEYCYFGQYTVSDDLHGGTFSSIAVSIRCWSTTVHKTLGQAAPFKCLRIAWNPL
jgi:hypothetical protein